MTMSIGPRSRIHIITMGFAGMGCTFMGSFLPSLAGFWHLQDRQSGLLLSCLFVGSFSGTLLLLDDLRRTLHVGSTAACTGLLLLSFCVHRRASFMCAVAALMLVGFGLGQVMSSTNLLVGSAPMAERPRALANIGGAWCAGALLSPLLTTVLLPHISAAERLTMFGVLFLLPALSSRNILLRYRPALSSIEPSASSKRADIPKLVLFWSSFFFLYGGIEAGIAGWTPMFVMRYQIRSVGSAQWVVSLLWAGLIIGRALMAWQVLPGKEETILRLAILTTVASLFLLLAARSASVLLMGVVLTGICLSPIFPLLLALSLKFDLNPRLMGVVLAASALGNAAFPAVMGLVSSISSLRIAMLLPLMGLTCLFFFHKQPLQAGSTYR